MNRRNFIKTSSVGILGLSTLSLATMTGCNVFSNIQTWIPIGLNAIQGIVTVLGPIIGPGPMIILGLVKASFADLSAAISEYNNDTNPADKSSLLAKIRTFMGDIIRNFQDFLSALNLGNNPIIAIVIGLANIVISAIEGFMGQLPPPTTIPMAMTLKVGRQTMTVKPKLYKNVSDFKKDFNSFAVSNGHSEIVIK